MFKTILATIMMMGALVMTASPAEASADVNAYMPKQLCKDGETIVRFAVKNKDTRDHSVRWKFGHDGAWGSGGAYLFGGTDGRMIMRYVVEAGDEFRVSVWMDDKKDKSLLLSRTVVAKDCS